MEYQQNTVVTGTASLLPHSTPHCSMLRRSCLST